MKKAALLFIFMVSSIILNAQMFSEESKQRGIDHSFRAKVLTGGGAAFFDYDNDGDDDLYLTGGLGRDNLYQNDGAGNFTKLPNDTGFDVTVQYNSMGVSTGDIDNDGFRDVFVCTWDYRNELYGPNLLFRNNGDGTFSNISESAGITGASYSTSSTFFDFDKDGFLDIYVVNHLEEAVFTQDSTGLVNGYDHRCFENYFYRNNGDLTFTEMAAEVGLNSVGCGLVAVATDIDFDNDMDLYVANDFGEYVVANELFDNQFPTKIFKDISVESGANIGLYGMGIAIGDYDQDLDMDFYVTNIGRNILIENKQGKFEDVTTSRGVENEKVTSDNLNTTGWGTAFLDVNNDTWLDLFVANGRIPALSFNATSENDPNKLFLNNGDKTFTDISDLAGIADERFARGFISSDIDQDGDLDMLTVVLSDWQPDTYTKLYLNQSDKIHNFIQFKLVGVESNRDAFGAKLWLYAGEKVFLREIYGGGASYASQSSSIVHFGLGLIDGIDSLKINWPNGQEQILYDLTINEKHLIEENTNLSTSNEEIFLIDNALVVFPNPFVQETAIQFSKKLKEPSLVKLINNQGQIVYTKKLATGIRKVSLLNLDFPSGLYTLQFISQNNWMSRKVVKIE